MHVEANLLPELEARYPGLGLAWIQSGVDEDAQTLAPLAYTLPIALLVIYLIIAVQFRSYAQPLVVLTAMPLAAAGAVLAHLLLGYDMNMTSLFGVVAVLGVVINDTLLLMDRCNSLRADSTLPAIAAISGAVRERFRPIFLTTVTDRWRPVARAVSDVGGYGCQLRADGGQHHRRAGRGERGDTLRCAGHPAARRKRRRTRPDGVGGDRPTQRPDVAAEGGMVCAQARRQP